MAAAEPVPQQLLIDAGPQGAHAALPFRNAQGRAKSWDEQVRAK